MLQPPAAQPAPSHRPESEERLSLPPSDDVIPATDASQEVCLASAGPRSEGTLEEIDNEYVPSSSEREA